MDSATTLYISGMGMLTGIGNGVAMNAAAANAGLNAYTASRFTSRQGHPIRLALVPDALFDNADWNIDEGDRHGEPEDHALKMALVALGQLVEQGAISEQAPLILAMNEPELKADCLPLDKLKNSLELAGHQWLNPQLLRSIHTGRAAGLEALDFAYQYLADSYPNGIIIGGSDSPCDYHRLRVPEGQHRLLTQGPNDGYAPGEGAAFIALTTDPGKALEQDGHIIALRPPGLAQEPGHWFSEEPYRGEGLDQAFKLALADYLGPPIQSIYSSMNGERFWAKEYGVATMRNREKLTEDARILHPAEHYGDLGSATATALIALAAHDLFAAPQAQTHLVYSSSDTGLRGALLMEKRPLDANQQAEEPPKGAKT